VGGVVGGLWGGGGRWVGAQTDLPLCTGEDGQGHHGITLHPNQKQESTGWRSVSSASRPDDMVLDPFNAPSTTAPWWQAAWPALQRHWRETKYSQAAEKRIAPHQAGVVHSPRSPHS